MPTPDQFLESLGGELSFIRDVAIRLSGEGDQFDSLSGALEISHRPRIGSGAFALRIFPGADAQMIADYEDIHRLAIFDKYRNLLLRMNGAHIFNLSLYGIPPSMAKRPPLLNRETSWPYDLASSQKGWKRTDSQGLMQLWIGSGPHNRNEHVGYFLFVDGSVEARLKDGSVLGGWPNLEDFLKVEVRRAEIEYPKYEAEEGAFMDRIRKQESSWVRRILGRFGWF
jgi:hypothetical protein